MAAPPVRDDVDRFLDHLSRGRSAGTVRSYRWPLELFATWAGERPAGSISAAELELEFVAGWESDFIARHGYPAAACTRRAFQQALRFFYRFLERYELLLDEAGDRGRNAALSLEPPRAEPHGHDWLQPNEEQQLLTAAQRPREHILVVLLRYSGIRIGEACALRDDDVNLAAGEIRIRNAKTPRGRRTIPIPPPLAAAIGQWRDHLEQHDQYRDHGYFLATRTGTPLAATHACRTLHRLAARAGIRQQLGDHPLTPHTLRRTYATDLLNRGVRLETISRLLGHASTTITETAYAELLEPTIRTELMRALHATTASDWVRRMHSLTSSATTHFSAITIGTATWNA